MKYHKRRKKAIKILNTKILTDPHKTAIFPVGIPYSLQKLKNPYRRDFSLRVATLALMQRLIAKFASGLLYCWSLWRNNNTAINLQMFSSSFRSRRLPHVTRAQCCQLGGFPAQLGWFCCCVAGFFLLLRVAVVWASFSEMHAVFGLFFRKIFLLKSIVFVNSAEVVKFVLT